MYVNTWVVFIVITSTPNNCDAGIVIIAGILINYIVATGSG